MTNKTKQQKLYGHIPYIDKEVWKDVVGYEGLYQVSDKGRVKRKKDNYIFKQSTYFGYKKVFLSKNNKRKLISVHRLVYEAFVGKIPEKTNNTYMVINHKDENRSNNNLENLEMITFAENLRYGNKKRKKNTSKNVYQYLFDGTLVRKFENAELCEKEGFSAHSIRLCCNGKINSHKGFIWSFVLLTKEQCETKNKNNHGKVIYQYTFDGKLVKTWLNMGDCERGGFSQTCISRCCLHKPKKKTYRKHKGYIWSFTPLFNND